MEQLMIPSRLQAKLIVGQGHGEEHWKILMA